MILTLVREQLRTQRTGLLWTAFVLAGAVGFSTYASVTGATDAAIDGYTYGIDPGHLPHAALLQLADLAPGSQNAEQGSTDHAAVFLASTLAISNASGSDAWAISSRNGIVGTTAENGLVQDSASVSVVATWGATPWDEILAKGRPPLAGEIVLPAATARDLRVGIGDSVDMLELGQQAAWHRLASHTISGLSYDSRPSTPWSLAPAYIDYADARVLSSLSPTYGEDRDLVLARIGWTSPTSPLGEEWREPIGSGAEWDNLANPSVMTMGDPAPWLVAVTLTVGATIMAFAVGRAQAATRVRWTATARALGARRSHLLEAGAVEAAALFAFSVAGGALGYVTVAGLFGAWQRSLAAPPPVAVTLPWWLLTALVGLAATLAVTSAAIPAVLATRVPPTAALKATSVTDEQELSRRVHVWPLGLGLAAVFIALLQPAGTDRGIRTLWALGALAGGVLLVALTVELARRGAHTVGHRWQRSSSPWRVYAGTMLGGHPRQAAALASIYFFALFGVSGWLAAHGSYGLYGLDLLDGRTADGAAGRLAELITTTYGPAALAILLAIAALGAAIIATSFRAGAGERKLAMALGLEPRAARRAHVVTWATAQTAGAFAGAIAGSLLLGAIASSQSADNMWGFVAHDLAGRTIAFAASLGVAALAGLFAALVALLAAHLAEAFATSATAQRLTSNQGGSVASTSRRKRPEGTPC